MKMKIRYIKYIPFGKQDIVIYPYIFWLSGFTPTIKLRRHAYIHIEQQKECLWIFFFLIYAVEFLIKFLFKWNIEKAYRNISFEREAYTNQADKNYLKNRKRFAWIKYIYEGKK